MVKKSDINSIQREKIDKEIKLNNLLKSKKFSQDDVNELKSEILHLDKQIEKIVGSNEIRRQKELKFKRINEMRINNYYAFKNKYKKINKMSSSVKRFIKVVDSYNNIEVHNEDNTLARVRI